MRAELDALHRELPDLPFLDVAERGKRGAIKLTPLDALPDTVNLRALKRDVHRRWGTIALIDMLKEAILRTGCLEVVGDIARGARIRAETLAERLLLVLYAYGTNTGIRAVAAGDHVHSEDELPYVRRRFLTADLVRSLAIEVANATFAACDPAIWRATSTTAGRTPSTSARSIRTS